MKKLISSIAVCALALAFTATSFAQQPEAKKDTAKCCKKQSSACCKKDGKMNCDKDKAANCDKSKMGNCCKNKDAKDMKKPMPVRKQIKGNRPAPKPVEPKK